MTEAASEVGCLSTRLIALCLLLCGADGRHPSELIKQQCWAEQIHVQASQAGTLGGGSLEGDGTDIFPGWPGRHPGGQLGDGGTDTCPGWPGEHPGRWWKDAAGGPRSSRLRSDRVSVSVDVGCTILSWSRGGWLRLCTILPCSE